ncbi:MAG: hypothetical protein RSG77_21720, partial [Hafnia sp.]
AAGKGPLHQYEYEHFLIKTHFKKSDFFDGDKHLKAKDVFANFEQRGLNVNFLTREQMRLALTGSYHAAGIRHDITLIPIREATESRINVFNQIYKNLLTMRKISDRDIKSLVLEVFSNVLANTKVDFMKVKAEAFREHDSLKSEIININENEQEILKLTTAFQNRENSRKHLADIKTRLRQISDVRIQQIPTELADTNDAKHTRETLIRDSRKIFDSLLEQKDKYSIALSKVTSFFETLETQRNNFTLLMDSVNGEHDLLIAKFDNDINRLNTERSDLAKSIDRSARRSSGVISKEISAQESRIEDLEDELAQFLNQDTWMQEMGYTNEQRQQLSRVLNPKFMSLRKSCMVKSEKSTAVFDAAFEISGNQFLGDVMSLDISSIRGQSFKEVNTDEITLQIESAKEYLDQLKLELNVASDVEAANLRLSKLDTTIKKEIQARQEFEAYVQNLTEEATKAENLAEYTEAVDELKIRLSNESDRNLQTQKEIDHLAEKLKQLGLELQNLKSIGNHTFFRDSAIEFLNEILVNDSQATDNDYITALIEEGNSLYGRFKGSESEFGYSKERVFTRYSKHAAEQDDAEIVRKLNEELESLPEKESFLGKLHHEAIVKLASALNNLNKNYLRLEGQINDFNRKINGKKVSNLRSFKLKLLPNQKALDAISTLMSSIEDDGLDLFSTSSDKKMDAAISNDAINYLGTMVTELGGVSLTLSELFELGFEIVDVNNVMSTYTSLDGHASNGTTMTMKALFNMNLIRFLFDSRHQTIHLPFYIDEASNIDDHNRLSLIAMSHDLGFTPIFASVDPIITAKYNINLEEAVTEHGLIVPEESWIRISEKTEPLHEDQLELI